MKEELRGKIQGILNEPLIQHLMLTEIYHHQLALDKFNEFKALEPLGKERNEKLILNIRNTKMFTFMSFLDSLPEDSLEHKTVKTIGELVSYTDVKGPNKHAFNMYSDKRALANCGIAPKPWLYNWLNYKEGYYNRIKSILIKNTIAYYENPKNNINCFSKEHRQNVKMILFNNSIDDGQDNFNKVVFENFSELGIVVRNELNRGVLYAAILYNTEIRVLWEC